MGYKNELGPDLGDPQEAFLADRQIPASASREDAEGRLARFQRDFQDWHERTSDGGARAWWQDQESKLNAQMKDLEASFDEIRAGGPGAWHQMKDGILRALDELERGFQKASQELNETRL